MRRLALVLAALPLVALCSCGAEGEAQAPTAEGAARNAAVVDLAGLTRIVEERREGGLLLNFWAMWCPPCVAELPELAEVAAEHAGDGADVVALCLDFATRGGEPEQVAAKARGFLSVRELDLPVLVYGSEDMGALAGRWGLRGAIPVTLAIDASGNVVDRHEGRADKARFEEMLRKATGG